MRVCVGVGELVHMCFGRVQYQSIFLNTEMVYIINELRFFCNYNHNVLTTDDS